MGDDSETSKNALKREAKKQAKKAKKEAHKANAGAVPEKAGQKTGQKTVYCCRGDPAICARWAASVAGLSVAFVSGEEQQPWTTLGDDDDDDTKVFGDLAIARWFLRSTVNDATPEERALVDQWCDFSLSYPSVGDVKALASMVEKRLEASTYLTSQLSLADVAVFAAFSKENYDDLNPRWRKLLPDIDMKTDAPKATEKQGGGDQQKQQKQQPKKKAEEEPSTNGGGVAVVGEEKHDSCPPLEGGVDGAVVTRFPPEPSGYLHIGHAKALLLNDYYARRYHGKLIVRFDDTNPSKEKGEYAENILKDVETLVGVDKAADYMRFTHTSDSFEVIQKLAVQLIEQGDAFVDDTPQEQMRKEREELKNSKRRDTPKEENLAKFEQICRGTLTDSCLRAKIDMQSPNGTLRDPVIFRTNATPHHKTGTKYKAYPTYDLACPIVDSLEGVTHALRTTEYNDRDAQYKWFQEKLKLRDVKIHSFSRINFVRTLMSKRKLAWLVEKGAVDGWNDPRFPTIQGVKRRGVSMASLREYVVSQGASRNVINLEWDAFWAINKAAYEPIAPRFQAVEKKDVARLELEEPLPPEVQKDGASLITVQLHPKDPAMGTRAMRVARTVLIEREDADAIRTGDDIVLMRWGVVKVTGKTSDSRLTGVFDKEATLKKKKPIHFLADCSDLVDLELVEYDYLITKPKLEEDDDLEDALTPVSRVATPAFGDPGLRNLKYGDVVQLERRGFYICDQALPKTIRLILIPDGKAKAPFSRLPSATMSASSSKGGGGK